MKKFTAIILTMSVLLLAVPYNAVLAADEDVAYKDGVVPEQEDAPEEIFSEQPEDYAIKDENQNYDAIIYDNVIPRERFMTVFNSKKGRPHLFLSDEEGNEGNIAAARYEGKDALFFKGKAQYAYGKAPENITAETKSAAVKVTFFDRYIDYIRYTYTLTSGSGKNVLICKNGTFSWRTETILLGDSKFSGVMKHGSDFYLNTYDASVEMGNDYIADVEFINLDTDAAAATSDGKKENVLQEGTLFLLSSMELLDKNLPLEERASGEAAATAFEKITGKKISLKGDITLKEAIEAFSEALGVKCALESDYIASGIIRNLRKHPQQWFGEGSYKTQTHGLYDIEVGTYERPLYNDDLVGLCYNLLFLKENGETYLAKLCKDEAFFDNMAATNDRNLVYSYYYEKGFRVKEETRVDEFSGETITEFYCPGTNMNAPYINELTTIDNENFVFCAGVDKQYGDGYPVVYNRKTGKTVTIDTRKIAEFAQVLAPTNVLYYTANNELWSYDINTMEKSMLYKEETTTELQEIPTVSNDGRYVCMFYGVINKSHPDTIAIYDTKTGEVKRYLGPKWVENNLYGPAPIFVGHVIMNPADPTIIQFLHGGGSSVEDRMWFLDTKTGKTWKTPGMTRTFSGGYGEQCVHWVWSGDGKRVYYCRMAATLTAEPGIVYYDFENPENYVVQVNDDYPFSHAVPNYNGELVVGDTNRQLSDGFYKAEVVLYDTVSDMSKLITHHSIWRDHPCHSHATFSYDSSMIFFNTISERDSTIRVGSAVVTDIVRRMREEGNDRHYQTASVTMGEKNTEYGIHVYNFVENETPKLARVNGDLCRVIEDGKSMYVDVDGQFVLTSDNRIVLRFTYFDNGEDPILLNYNTNAASEVSRSKNFKTIYIPRRNTNKWVTREILITDASFRGAINCCDMSLAISGGGSNAYIKKIEATALK